jgi:hypothetical protein
MRIATKFGMVSALTGFALCGTMFASLAQAQDPGGQPPPASAQGAPGGGRVRGQGQAGGRFGGFGGGMPFASGTITGGDANASTITITNQFGGGTQTIKVTPDTQFVSLVTVTVADLKRDDMVQVQGVPSGITASTITAGDPPAFMQGGRNRGGAAAPAAPGNPAAPGAQPNAAAPRPQGFATATGKIVAKTTASITISLGNDVDVVLKLAPDTKITKYMPIKFSSLKVGDQVMATGQAGADGTFTATGLGVNMNNGRGGFGGFGGRGGGFGPGGANGGGNNPGGFGGRGGGRRNRGGGNGQPGGNGAPQNPTN